MSSHVFHATRTHPRPLCPESVPLPCRVTHIYRNPPPHRAYSPWPALRLSLADAGRRGADQFGDIGVRGTLIGFQILGGEPAVLVGGGPLPFVQALEAHLGRLNEDGVEGLVLDDTVAAPGELDRVLGDGLAESPGFDGDAYLLVHLAGGRLTQRLAALGRAADGEPEGVIGMVRIPAVQQQHAPLRVNRQHPGGLPAQGARGQGGSGGDGSPPRGVWGDGSPQERGGLGGSSPRASTAHGYSTILEMGISSMSWAPAAFRAGVSVLTPRLGTTVSTAFMFPRASAVIVGEDRAGSMSVTAASRPAGTLSFSRTLPRAWIAPRSSRAMSSMAARFSGSANAGAAAISSV